MTREQSVVLRVMRANRSRDTAPELLLRRELHRRGIRYRLHAADVPGKPDLVWRQLRLAVFVDGDYWHGRKYRHLPSLAAAFPTNASYWVSKLERNMARDAKVNSLLAAAGWRVLRLWESDIHRDLPGAADEVAAALIERRRAGTA